MRSILFGLNLVRLLQIVQVAANDQHNLPWEGMMKNNFTDLRSKQLEKQAAGNDEPVRTFLMEFSRIVYKTVTLQYAAEGVVAIIDRYFE